MKSLFSCPKCERGGTGPHPAGCTPESRFGRKLRQVGECLEWQGARHKFGYGQFRVGNGTKRGKMIYAHRFAYELEHGPIPDGMEVLHTCDNPPCCRGSHLVLGTQMENMQDMNRKGRRRFGVHVKKTHCVHGHAFTVENTYIDKQGWRACRTCHRIAERERKQRIAA